MSSWKPDITTLPCSGLCMVVLIVNSSWLIVLLETDTDNITYTFTLKSTRDALGS